MPRQGGLAFTPQCRKPAGDRLTQSSTGARPVGWLISFEAISYVNQSMFGQGAVAANALLRMISVWFALSGGSCGAARITTSTPA